MKRYWWSSRFIGGILKALLSSFSIFLTKCEGRSSAALSYYKKNKVKKKKNKAVDSNRDAI